MTLIVFRVALLSSLAILVPETKLEVGQTASLPEDDAAKTAAFSIEYYLTQREQQVLSCLAQGKTDGEIAQKLFISPNTVRFHVGNILKKTECSTRVEAARMMQTFRPS